MLKTKGKPLGEPTAGQVAELSLLQVLSLTRVKAVSGLSACNTGRSGPEVRAQAETQVQLSA